MEPKGMDFYIFTNTSPVFKGISVMITGLIGLYFCWWMIKRWQEPLTWQFKIFIGLCGFITLYGAYILIFQPAWWIPPWWEPLKR